MSAYLADLDTHSVTNQPPPLEDVNLYTSDAALMAAVDRAGGGDHQARLTALGAQAGSAEAIRWGIDANRHLPELESYDRYGHRLDQVRFHPAYHALMAQGIEAGVAAVAWDGTAAGHVLHSAIMYMIAQDDAGTTCPMSMTYASVPALRANAAVASEWVPRITAARYDPAFAPTTAKAGVTIGMAMTEKQGGSDVRANATRAEPTGDGDWYRLTGHKWFCSAPMCDAFLTLAYADGGLTCFLVPRWLPDGGINAGFRVMRLKDKLGDRSNASSEIEYHGALAQRLGDEGRGIATIIQMVQHTRLDCVIGSAANIRAATAQALWHCAHRTAFQRRLIDHPAMAAVLADLVIESEAATALGFRIAQAFDQDEPLARLLTPIAKYWVCKRAPGAVYEAMECLGGAGYVEAGPMPRLFRQSPLNAIWEGSGNVIALDVLRAIAREPEAVASLMDHLGSARGRDGRYDHYLDAVDLAAANEGAARQLVGQLALAAQASVLLLTDSSAAEAFCSLRLGPALSGGGGHLFGASGLVAGGDQLIRRALPHG